MTNGRWAVVVIGLVACSKSDSKSGGSAATDKRDSEVRVLFAEIDARQENYRMDNASYASDAAALKVDAKVPVGCKLQLAGVASGGAATVPDFPLTPPASGPWFYAKADCDVATYVHTSFDGAIYRKLPNGPVEKLVH